MTDAVGLDPGDYGGTYKLIGGALALDFANLVSYRGTARHHDWLVPDANTERWTQAVGIRTAPTVDTGTLCDMRELLARIFLAVADADIPTRADMDRLGGLAAHAAARRCLRFDAGADAATWVGVDHSLVDVLALDATAILTSADTLRRVTACGECRWVFVDTTRNHSRRWCDPADCGNRARQRRHYHRSRS